MFYRVVSSNTPKKHLNWIFFSCFQLFPWACFVFCFYSVHQKNFRQPEWARSPAGPSGHPVQPNRLLGPTLSQPNPVRKSHPVNQPAKFTTSIHPLSTWLAPVSHSFFVGFCQFLFLLESESGRSRQAHSSKYSCKQVQWLGVFSVVDSPMIKLE